MPITEQELKEVRAELKRLDQILEGLQYKAAGEEGRLIPAGEPSARPTRLR
jgi:hypothetical protein